MDKKLSIVIPEYNSEKYIKDCILSLQRQTYKNIEIIVVNDGSKDSTLEILNELAKEYNNLIVLTQENHGIAYTRNRGIEFATGEYLMFMDNDDSMKEDCIEMLLSRILETDADMVIGGYRRITPEGKVLEEMILTKDEWAKFRMISPWGRIMKTQFVREHNLKFGDYKMGEDSYFNVTAYGESDKIITTDYVGYNWIYRDESVSNTTQKKVTNSPIPFLEGLIERNKNQKYMKPKMFEYFVIKYVIWNLTFICKQSTKKEMSKAYTEYFNWLSGKIPDYKKNPYVGLGKPKGETVLIRLIVTIFCKMPKSIVICIMMLYKKIV